MRTPLILLAAAVPLAFAGAAHAQATTSTTPAPAATTTTTTEPLGDDADFCLDQPDGRCPTPTPTTTGEMVTVCIQGHTTTAPRGATNPAGYPYAEGPCEPEAPAPKAPKVRATPRFTG